MTRANRNAVPVAITFDQKSAVLQRQANQISYQQSILGLASDKLSLLNLQRSIVLPGGASLSTNPKAGLAELERLAKSDTRNKPALDAFILQYKAATLQVAGDKVGLKQSALSNRKDVLTTALQLKTDLLTVEQDTANKLKIQVTRQIADLTDSFNRHAITYARFKRGIDEIVARGAPAMKKAGVTLGSAFAHQYTQQVTDILRQAGFIEQGPNIAGTTVQKIRNQIARTQTGLTQKILKESQKQSTYLKTLSDAATGTVGTPHGRNPGSQGKTTRGTAGTRG